MAPISGIDVLSLQKRFPAPTTRTSPPTRSSLTPEGGFLEAWAQGYNVGSLIILILIVFCNYRSGIWLHKLILLELVLALWHGTFIFLPDPYYGWYLSATATLLFISYFLHNVVSWLKIRPFLPRWGSRAFIISLILVQPFWVAEAWSNFSYFNSLGSDANIRMRPWEALVRDPWWIFTTWKLIDSIKKTYNFHLWTLIKINRRFGVMLLCMFISIAFVLTDVVVSAAKLTASSGINPYWRFALVFKCASDTIFLDDFKSVLDSIIARRFSASASRQSRKSSGSVGRGEDFIDSVSLENPRNTPVRSSISSSTHSVVSKSKSLFRFSKKNRTRPPKIRVDQANPTTLRVKSGRHDTWVGRGSSLSVPVKQGHEKPQLAPLDSDDHMMTGSIV